MNYIFEEILINVGGIDYYATGSVDIDYNMNSPDYDVGENRHWAEINDYSDFHAYLVCVNEEHPDIDDMEYNINSDVASKILEKIHYDICYACEDEYNDTYYAFRD